MAISPWSSYATSPPDGFWRRAGCPTGARPAAARLPTGTAPRRAQAERRAALAASCAKLLISLPFHERRVGEALRLRSVAEVIAPRRPRFWNHNGTLATGSRSSSQRKTPPERGIHEG